jgi:hypothetical protein
MLSKQIAGTAIGVAIGLVIGATIPRVLAQDGAAKPQTVADFPDLVSGLRATPGCLSVRTSSFDAGKQLAIFAWFKNKAAVNSWYHSTMHRGAMKKFFPTFPAKRESLESFKDEKSPLLVVATVTPSDKPKVQGTQLSISQIGIEIYTPVPGGLTLGGGFGPVQMDVPGLVRM